jgi:hypothetical protein
VHWVVLCVLCVFVVWVCLLCLVVFWFVVASCFVLESLVLFFGVKVLALQLCSQGGLTYVMQMFEQLLVKPTDFWVDTVK